ncbi:MAG TPA: hypothetical protein VGF99_12445, partial [Myxococcota bacterium]
DTTDGRTRIVVGLPVDNIDFEDIAVGPCPDLSGPCVFVADTGDNDGDRDVVFVHAFPEPDVSQVKPAQADDEETSVRVDLEAVWTMPLVFPDGAHPNIEALAVLPDATAMLLFEKVEGERARIYAYRAPWTTQNPDAADLGARTAELTGSIEVPASVGDDKERRITAASLHWSGTRLLLRTTGAILEYSATDASGFFDLIGRAPRQQVVSPPDEEQGEAITHDGAGTAWLSISEIKKKREKAGETPILHRLDCSVAAP